jgi:hypothetical protein
MAQCAKLSTGTRLLELSRTFAKYLDLYAHQVLLYALERSPSLEDVVVILNTADYCYMTCNQLEEKLRARIDDDIKGEVDLQAPADAFMGIASSAIRALVRRVEAQLEHVWREMRNFPWAKLDTVSDQSSYVGEMARVIGIGSEEVLRVVTKPQYTRAFCDNLVEAVVLDYCSSVFQCKPISEAGAEQMLLDSYALKKGLLSVPVLLAEPGTQPPAAYVLLRLGSS